MRAARTSWRRTQAHHDVRVTRLDRGLRVAAAALRIGKQANLSLANLKMEPAFAVGGHVSVRLAIAVELDVHAGSWLVAVV